MTAAVPPLLPPALTWPLVIAVAALLGSFLNVCISRMPRGESVVVPSSHCPHCDVPIRSYDNIPLVSFVALRGRCRACRGRISWRYPLVEALAIGTGVLTLTQHGLTWEAGRVFVLGLLLIAVAFIDLETLLIPDRITLPGIVAGLASWVYPSPSGLGWALVGLVVGGGVFYLVAVLSRGGMGGGDVKLGAMLGAFLGWPVVLVAIFLGILAGGAVATVLLLSGRRGRKDLVPFGPFLALGGVLAMFWGRRLLTWYLA